MMPATLVDRAGYHLSTSGLPKKRVREIVTDLTVRPQQVVEYAKPRPFKIHRAGAETLLVPRAWGHKHFGQATYRGREGEPINLSMAPGFKLDPARHQPEAVDAILQRLRGPYSGGLLSLFTGAGKTVIACAIIQRMRVKALVLVHKSCLLEQWTERLNDYLPGVRIGRIQGARVDTDCDVAIGMIQSIAIKEEGTYGDDVFDSFGLLIVDECHVVCTKVFSKALERAQTKWMIGLSATIQRKDKLEKVIEYHLGDVIFSAERKHMTAQVRLVYADASNIRELINPKTQKPDRVAMVTALVNDESRNRVVAKEILSAVAEGRKILVLSERRQHLADIESVLHEMGCTDTGMYIGGMSQEQLKHSEARQVIFGSFSMASTGLDIKDLSCLVLASPLTDITQACGRILRNVTPQAKLIIDIVDRASVFIGQMRRRVALYHKQNFTVRGDEAEDTLRQTKINTNPSLNHLAIVDA